MRKINRLKLGRLELQAKLYGERLKMLECEHAPKAAIKYWCFATFGTTNSFGWRLECSKCGKEMGDLTEIEYLEARLEEDRDSFLGASEEMGARLKELKAQGAAETSS